MHRKGTVLNLNKTKEGQKRNYKFKLYHQTAGGTRIALTEVDHAALSVRVEREDRTGESQFAGGCKRSL